MRWKKILQKLRFNYDLVNEVFNVTIPSRRGDIIIFEDMLEEIARIYGYDHLPYTLPANASKPGGLTDEQLLKRKIKAYLEGAGFSEAITYSLLKKTDIQKFISPEQSKEIQPVALSMPMSEDHQYLRQSLLPELLNRAAYNTARKQQDIALYETGAVFLTEETSLSEQPQEQLRLAGVMTGKWVNFPWQQDVKTTDFYVLKGVIEGLFHYIDRNLSVEQAVIADMHPGRCAMIKADEEMIGFMGQVHPAYTKQLDLKDTYVFDLNLAYILETTKSMIHYEAIPKYPSIVRDIAFVMKQEHQASDIKHLIMSTGAPLVKQVEVFDVYTGENVGADEKSIAFNIHFQDPEKTLTDQEVDESMKEIISTVNEQYQTHVRS